jgi:hypothetical protein
MEAMVKKKNASNRGGRPPKPPGKKYLTPARQLGRVCDEDWELLQTAAAKTGKSFTGWAVEILLRNAKRQLTD